MLSICAYGNLLSHIMLAEDITLDHARLLGLCKIADSLRQDSIAIICPAVLSKETN